MAGIWRRWIGAAGLALAAAIFLALPALAEGAAGGAANDWFYSQRLNVLISIIVVSAAVAYYMYHAQRGKTLYIRPIAGLNAMEEAVGRATEMGKPILFVPGINDMDDIQTLAAMSILGHVAYKTAQYEAHLRVPVSKSMVMSTAQEVVKESYLRAGRPDLFNVNDIWYLTDEQFAYVAGVDGIMLREKPAANFYMGSFYAESLILAETGHSTGAIQIAGTAQVAQLPFFVAACDYTLIGEELFAASAYLSGDAHQISSVKGQDFAKAIIAVALVLGAVFTTIHVFVPGFTPAGWFADLFKVIQ